MNDFAPKVVVSGKSLTLVLEGYRFSIQIHRIETETEWTLEVIAPGGHSTVWLESFETARDARDTALSALEDMGPQAFLRTSDPDQPETGALSAG
ncbi:hypothetical protein [Marivita geojedonensis]|uniref:Uncharacterized protein n=2 Tax=Marivita geojedonensis TaxID=1123756 RepID=A0A1X4NKD7_9RHOB|nr:hypothetical protein [Marivita geojedonensis]OSQ50694.1 hypothetical protein MGEO_11955 [Marivita geojedonensis]PRY76685.1 hypothetical protein CLV76_1106 [Marivita geojedonensis]